MCQLLITKTVIMQHICLIFRVLWSSFHLQVVLYLCCLHIRDDCATINIESKDSSSCTLCIRWIHGSSSRKPAQPSKEAVGDVWYCISRETFSEEQWIAPLCNTQILPFCCSESQCFTSICFLRCSFASTKTSYKAELLSLILAEACKALTEDKVSFWRKTPFRKPNCTE